jgi:ssDNA-binding Zn-finger/Zn-ribbon topoisomerase 1
MGVNDRMVFQTPGKDQMTVDKGPPTGETCPRCGGDDVRRYPIGWYKGPRMVVKCQSCFHSLAVQRPAFEDNWPPFRAATYDWQASASERAGRD